MAPTISAGAFCCLGSLRRGASLWASVGADVLLASRDVAGKLWEPYNRQPFVKLVCIR